jgi:hypothetical protein
VQSDVRIVLSRDEHLPSFRRVFDTVARERRYLAFLEAPALETIQRFVTELRQNGGVQMFAVDSEDHVVGWCDITRISREGYRHVGVLGMIVSQCVHCSGVTRPVEEDRPALP